MIVRVLLSESLSRGDKTRKIYTTTHQSSPGCHPYEPVTTSTGAAGDPYEPVTTSAFSRIMHGRRRVLAPPFFGLSRQNLHWLQSGEEDDNGAAGRRGVGAGRGVVGAAGQGVTGAA